MNCPNCNSPNADGKKYCADCGTPLDPQMQRLEIFVKAQVEKAIQEKFKDQKLVDVETSQAIAERLHGWGKLFGFFVALPVAALLIVLSFLGIERYSDFKSMIGGVEQQVKPKLEQAQKTASAATSEAEDAKKTIEGATVEAKRQLGSATELAKSVKGLSDRVSGLEQQTSNQMKGSSQRIDARVVELDQKIDAAAKDIAEQQKKLASTDELVKALFSKRTTEYFSTTANGPTAVIVPVTNAAFVFLLLKSVPIDQTIEVKWRVFSQPRGSYGMRNNVLTFTWGESADSLKQFPLEITYVPDPTSKAAPFKMLTLKDRTVFADETKLMVVPP
jgi:F0F1-type ATP synthase membrane subunit b/b'